MPKHSVPPGQRKAYDSPYLSDRVLLAALNEKPTPLPAGHVRQIIEANSPVTNDVMNAVINRNLPPGILMQIQNAQVGTSQREETIHRVDWLKEETLSLEGNLVNAYMENNLPENAKNVLTLSEYADSKKLLAEILYGEKDYSSAQIVLNDVILFSEAAELYESSEYVEIMNLLIDLGQSGRTINDLTGAELNTVNSVAATPTLAAFMAQVILYQINGEYSIYPIMKINYTTLKSANLNSHEIANKTSVKENKESVYIYPNPNNGDWSIEYYLPVSNVYTLNISTLTGNMVKSIDLPSDKNLLNMKDFDLNNGIYIIRVVADKSIKFTDKLIIIK